MRFFVDECTGPKVAKWLSDQGYEVFSVYDEARGLDDDSILRKAFNENWILITNDKDFGEKVYREGQFHRGIVFLRLEDERAISKVKTLKKLLEGYENKLADNFVVVTEKKIRFGHKITNN